LIIKQKNNTMKNYFLLFALMILSVSCSKKNDAGNVKDTTVEGVNEKTETNNGITYRSFTKDGLSSFKGIIVIGSGNDENNPTPGTLNGGAETELAETAAKNGYAAAIVQYRKTPGTSDWNTSAQMIGEDYDKCITALSTEYGVDKSKSVVGGFSYSSFLLLTNIAYNNNLTYSKGVLAACGSTDADKAQKFKIPVFSINCSGNNEGDFGGKALYDQIPANSAVKAKSAGVTDNSCSTHCGGDWTTQLYAKANEWLQ
jgi:hypothetical protein